VDKLIIASSMYKRSGVPAGFWEGFKKPDFAQMPEAYKQVFLSINPSSDALHVMFNQCANRMLHFTDIPDETIQAIRHRVLILTGDKDVALPEHAVEMYRRLPHAALAIFPGGHGDYIGELTTKAVAHTPPVALPVIEDFLKAAP
jgi:pimeloyl-ACP methyl ester carboxylesterase